jgi:hypothetical protein
MFSFWFHYNKPATASSGTPKMTVHYRGQCHVVDHVVCKVPVSTRSRSTQPRLVMAGRGVVRMAHSVATITEV